VRKYSMPESFTLSRERVKLSGIEYLRTDSRVELCAIVPKRFIDLNVTESLFGKRKLNNKAKAELCKLVHVIRSQILN